MALRSYDKSRSSWALIGLAVRIAHGLGFHRDGDGRAFRAFDAEMRRRLWWQILVLDMRISEDRGSEPVILEGSFNTRMPCNLNDEDFGDDSQHPLPDKKGITDMTFSLIYMDVLDTGRNVNFIPPTSERQPLTLQQKEEIVKNCTDRIESRYLAGCDPFDQSTWLVSMMGRLLTLKLWLVVQYPLQRRTSAPQKYPRGQSLRTVVAYLTTAELIEENDSTAGYRWFFETYVPWHALAVALAELCTETQGPLADRAWSIINKGYEKWSDRVADTKDGMLWRPVKRLLRRAQDARKRDQQKAAAEAAGVAAAGSQPSPLDSVLRNYEVASGLLPGVNLEGSRSNSYDPMAFEDLDLINQTTDPALELDLFAPMDMATGSMDPSGGSVNWDNWNEFIFDVGAVGADVPLSLYEWPTQM